MRFLILAIASIVMVALLPTRTMAMTEPYLQAVELAKKKSFDKAIPLFRSQLEAFADNPIYRNRTRVWLALSLLTTDVRSPEAETLLQDVLCDVLSTAERATLPYSCPNPQPPHTPTAQIDTDMATAAVAAAGSLAWHHGEYVKALQFLTLAGQRASDTRPKGDNMQPALNQLASTQPDTPEEAIAKAQREQALIKQSIIDQAMSQKGQISPEQLLQSESMQAMVQSMQSEMFAKKQQELAQSMPQQDKTSGVVSDPQSFAIMAQQSALQAMVAQMAAVTCQNPEMGKALARRQAERLSKKAKEGVDITAVQAQLLKIADEGVSDCSGAALASQGIAQPLRAEEKVAKRKTEKEARKAQQRLNRAATREPDYFYGLAASTLCQYTNVPQVQNIADAERVTREALAGGLEASRGQYIQSFAMAQRPVLVALNDFLDHSEQLRARSRQFDPFNNRRNSLLKQLAYCADTLNLAMSFSRALQVAAARPQTNEDDLKYLLATAQRLRENERFKDTFRGTQEASEHGVLGEFYLRAHQPEKALPELQQAIAGIKPDSRFAPFPEYAYTPLVMAARGLKGMIAALQQTGKSISSAESALQQLRKDAEEIRTKVEKELGQPKTQNKETLAQDSKQKVSEAFESPDIQSALQQLQAMQPQSGENSDDFDIMSRIQQGLQNVQSSNKGDDTSDMNKILEHFTSSSPSQLETDLYGTILERQYYLLNNHAQLLLQIAQLELDMRKLEAAQKRLAEAEAYMQDHPGWIGERTDAYLQFTRARLFAMQNKPAEASKAFAKAVNGWYFTPHSMLQIIASPLEAATDILEMAGAYAIEQGQVDQAFAYLELARLADWNSDRLYGVLTDTALKANNRSLQQQVEQLQAAARKQATSRGDLQAFTTALEKGSSAATSSQRDELSAAQPLLTTVEPLTPWVDPETLGRFVVHAIQQAKRQQAYHLRKDRMAFLSKQAGAKINTNVGRTELNADDALALSTTIRNKLSSDTLLISIWMGRETSYITAVDNRGSRAHTLPSLPLIQLTKAFNESYLAVQANKLYQQLLAPYLDRSYRKLILVTNGPLQNTPFAAFSTSPGEKEWLGDQYLLRALPRADLLLARHSTHASHKRLLVLDGSAVPRERPLPNAADEINTLLQYFSGKHIPPQQLTKATVVQQLPQYPLVHFAGHSKVNNDLPDYSSLALYDQNLYLAELQQLPLEGVELMVLASCESATNADFSFGNEFSALHESFLDAGAHAVVASLFAVEDESSSVFFSRFYQLLAEGQDKDQAMQGAQRYLRENNFDHPADWAAFVLSGSETALSVSTAMN